MPAKTCGHEKKDGSHCGAVAGWGTQHPGVGRCRYHGGSSDVQIVAGMRVLRDESFRREFARMAIPVADGDPEEILLHAVREAAGNVAFLGAAVNELIETYELEGVEVIAPGTPRAAQASNSIWRAWMDMDDGKERARRLFGPKIELDRDGGEHITGELARGVVTLYGEWMDRLAKYSKMALDTGIARRRLDMAQQHGEMLVLIVDRVLHRLELDEAKRLLARELIAEEFAAVTDDASA